MRQRNTVGGVHIKGLGKGRARTTLRGIANVPYAKATQQLGHMTGPKNIAYQALALALHELAP